jgi:hypothetical protein
LAEKEPLSLAWLDILGTFKLAEELRQHIPLLLAGGDIEELQLLMGSICGPSTRCRANNREKIYHRICSGLVHLGIVPNKDIVNHSDLNVHQDISLVEAMRKLLLMDVDEANAVASQKVFGKASLSLAEVLDIYYDLKLDDFD